MSTPWLDFKQLREQLNFAAVLQHYGVELKTKRRNQHQGFCPLPTHQGHKRSPSFSAQLDRGIWKCFGCGESGNVLDFAARMEGINPLDGQELRRVGLLLARRFGTEREIQVARQPTEQSGSPLLKAPKKADRTTARPAIVNAPLDFELKGLDASHPYLRHRGFTGETITHFGLGYCARGLMQGRIAIPLHDPAGQLVGYAGRLVDDQAISEDHPKYRFPGPREREGKAYEVHKSLFLYNQFAVGQVRDLIIVEGFASIWWLWQHGYRNAVALMGWSCSEVQAQSIVDMSAPNGTVWVLPDGDAAGERCAAAVLTAISPYRCVRWARLQHDEQPTDCSADELAALLADVKHLDPKCQRRKNQTPIHAGMQMR